MNMNGFIDFLLQERAEEQLKPAIQALAIQLASAGMDHGPDRIATLLGKPKAEVTKMYNELTKKRPFKEMIKVRAHPGTHKVIAAIMARRFNSSNNLEEVSGMSLAQMRKIAISAADVVVKFIPNFKLTWLEGGKNKWTDYTPEERLDMVKKAIQTLSRGRQGSIVAIDVAKHLKAHDKIDADEETLRRDVDRITQDKHDLRAFFVRKG